MSPNTFGAFGDDCTLPCNLNHFNTILKGTSMRTCHEEIFEDEVEGGQPILMKSQKLKRVGRLCSRDERAYNLFTHLLWFFWEHI